MRANIGKWFRNARIDSRTALRDMMAIREPANVI
jgi:hypothetical protein